MSGLRNQKFTIEQRTETLDALGDAILSYATLGTAWGNMTTISGNERLIAQQTKADVSHKIVLRYAASYATLTPADRLTLGARIFDIVSAVDPDGNRSKLELRVLERL